MKFEPFDLYTPGARRLYTFEFHKQQALLSAEVRRVVDALETAAPARVAKGQMTAVDAAALAELWRAIADDLEAQDRWLADGAGGSGWSLADKLRELGAASGVAWSAKVLALRAEIVARRAGYPADVARGRLTDAVARQQLERIEAVHDLYWRHCYAFDGTADELRALGAAMTDAMIARYGPAAVPCTVSSDDAASQLEELDRDADNRQAAA